MSSADTNAGNPADELPKQYDHQQAQDRWYKFWEERKYFHADPTKPGEPFCIVIPPPNVTGALHLGHALNNTLQDSLIRLKRMQGFNTLWMPGTDHAGIATQAVVERRLLENEKLSRHQLGREKLVERIWEWKHEYEARILGQLRQMGCSCDWDRTRFTLDEVCARAVRHTFFKMFQQGYIYRGKRLVNWDTYLQTAVSDDEVFHETVKGHFWHFKYPVIKPQAGEPTHVTVATTRPETMLGDTAVAVHPDPAGALDKAEAELKQKLADAPQKEKDAVQKQIDDLMERRKTMLPLLITLREMAKAGRKLKLPLPVGGTAALSSAGRPTNTTAEGSSGTDDSNGFMYREIPLVADEWAKPELGTGCVKITPAHDPNDYEVGKRQSLPMINILNPDGTLNENGGPYAGLTMKAARAKVVADLEALGLMVEIEDREIDLAHSDRSKTPIEPYLADQWFVKMSDRDDGKPGLAQMAMDAVTGNLTTNGTNKKTVRISPERYAKSYLDWLGEKRDWCVGRQLWWGHRVPVWYAGTVRGGIVSEQSLKDDAISQKTAIEELSKYFLASGVSSEDFHIDTVNDYEIRICVRSESANERLQDLDTYWESLGLKEWKPGTPRHDVQFTHFMNDESRDAAFAIKHVFSLRQDDDVLDTWFSSALWPHSTLGWPEQTPELKKYYPTSVLITSRDIITLWVARMVITGLFNVGEIPFQDVFIHPKILDGYGETMSKSKGNGVDPIDVMEKFGADALRFGLAYLTTETQDVRMPVEFECPHCEKRIEQTKKNRVLPKIACPHCGKEFSTQWAKDDDAKLPRGAVVSERFELARNFCNKLWNASRFALMNLQGYTAAPVGGTAEGSSGTPITANTATGSSGTPNQLSVEDRWLLSRLATVTKQVTAALEAYQYSEAARVLYEFAWDEFCSFYVEMVKARLQDEQQRPVAQCVLASALDTLLRLLHPLTPFITEEVWQLLGQVAPQRGLNQPTTPSDSVMVAQWPIADETQIDAAIEARFGKFQQVLAGVREIRSRQNIPPKAQIQFAVKCDAATAELLQPMTPYFASMAGATATAFGPTVAAPELSATFTLAGMEVFVDLADLIDVAAEIAKQEKEADKLRGFIAGKEKKLSQPNFAEKAPANVVQAERDSLQELQTRLAAIESAVAKLKTMKKS